MTLLVRLLGRADEAVSREWTTLFAGLTARGAVKEHTHSYVTKTASGSGHYEQVQVGTEQIPIYEEQPKYENKWVEDSPTSIRVCEICGQQE